MNVAALALEGNACVIDPNQDVNETAAIVLGAKRGMWPSDSARGVDMSAAAVPS